MKSYISTWKKQYAEESQKTNTTNRKASSNPTNATNSTISSNVNGGSNQPNTSSSSMTSTTSVVNNVSINNSIATSSSNVESSSSTTTYTTLNPPALPPPLPIHPQPPPMQQQHNAHNQTGLQPYQIHGPATTTATVIYDQTFSAPPPHDMPDMREYIHIEKPPPMYPGHSNQQQHPMPQMANPGGGYVHQNHLDPIEQALSKGDWSSVSDRSLLQYALQV